MMRVLLLHDYAGSRGGAELLGLDLRRGLKARGIDARLMTTTADARDMTEEEAPDYLCAGTTGKLRALPETYNPSARAKLTQVLRDFKPDIVQILMFLTAMSPAILAPLRKIPTVYMHLTYREICPTGLRWRPGHGLCTEQAGWRCQELGCFSKVGIMPRLLQMRALAKHADVIDRSVAPSQAMAKILRDQGWPVTDILPFGIPPTAMAEGDVSDTPLIAFAGRLTEEKGVSWLLDAVAHAGDRLNARVEILGDGPYRATLEAQAARLGLQGRVKFHGKVERAKSQDILGRAWVQVIPSLWPEPFGLVTVEALTRGTPALVTDQGAPPEMVTQGETGWIVPVGDVPALADRLIEATSDKARVRKMGASGAQAARAKYDIDRWVDGYVDIYSQLLASSPGEGAAWSKEAVS